MIDGLHVVPPRLPLCLRCGAGMSDRRWKRGCNLCVARARAGHRSNPVKTRCADCGGGIPPVAERRWRHAVCVPCRRARHARWDRLRGERGPVALTVLLVGAATLIEVALWRAMQ